MRGYNHVVGGLAWTGSWASISNINILEKPEYIAATVFFAVLPDIDHPHSLAGKILRPLSGYIYKNFGHRTLTHSLPFYVAVLVAVGILEYLFGSGHPFLIITAFALLSHLIFDMATKQGIPFFYPFFKNPCVVPGNPKLRFANENIFHQAGFFTLSGALFALCLPLYQNGFLTTFNKTFIDFDHIEKEARRSSDVLEVEFTEKNKQPEKGYLIEVSGSRMILFCLNSPPSREGAGGGVFRQLEKDGTSFQNFRHTGRKPNIRQISVFGVSADSLKTLLHQPIITGQVQANTDIKYYEGSLLKSGKDIKFEYQTGFDFFTESPDLTNDKMQLELAQARIGEKLTQHRRELGRLDSLKRRLSTVTALYSQATDYEKGKLIEQRNTLESNITAFKADRPDLSAEQVQLQILQDKLKTQKTLLNANLTVWKF